MKHQQLVNIGWGNGMMTGDTNPLHEPVLTYYQLDPQENSSEISIRI